METANTKQAKLTGKEIFTIGIWLILAFFITVGCDDSNPVEEADGGPQSHDEMLESLGVDVNNPPEKLDKNGELLPEDWQPLGRSNKAFKPIMELYVAGGNGVVERENPGAKSQGIVEYDEEYLKENGEYGAVSTVLFSEDEDEAWADTSTYINAISGDTDGDGFDEIMTVYYLAATNELVLRFVDYHNGEEEPEVRVQTIASETDFDPDTNLGFHGMRPCLSTGDLDGDGMDELLVAFDRVYILDDSEAGFYEIESRVISDEVETNPICVAAGDFDGDNIDEFVVTYTEDGYVYYSVYNSTFAEPFDNMEDRQAVKGTTNLFAAAVTTGDVDGDKLDEIILSGRSTGISTKYIFPTIPSRYEHSCTKTLFIVDDAQNGFELTDHVSYRKVSGSNYNNCNNYAVQTLDFDGDFVDEIFDGRLVLDDMTEYDPEDEEDEWPILHTTAAEALKSTAGDVNEDLRADILYIIEGGTMRAIGMDSSNTVAIIDEWATGALGAITTANVDDDSPILSYREQELQYTDPVILSVIASSPYYDDIGQVTDNATTSFGTVESVEQSTEQSHGFTVGTSISYEQDFSVFGVTVASFEFSTEFEYAMDWRYGNGTAMARWTAYDCAPGEDKVVFTAVPMDVYYYEVVSSANPDFEVGSTVTINIPREPETLSVTREYYNSHNGDTPDIDETVLAHEFGDPMSYPTETEKNQMMNIAGGSGYESNAIVVGQGAAETRIGMEINNTKTFGRDINTSVTISAAAGAGGFKVGASAGYQYGFSYDLSTSEGMFFEGALGDIPEEEYTQENKYEAGLFAYPHNLGEQTFMLVTYWVEDL